jgi:hypothetical protein
VKQRTKFSIMIEFLKPLTPFLRIGFKNYANRQTAFNAAMSYNVNNAVEGEVPDLELDFPKSSSPGEASCRQKMPLQLLPKGA